VVSKAFVLGALLIVGGVMWRAVVARKRRARVLDGMSSPDPGVRASAMRRISRTGIAEYAAGISSLVALADDPIRQGELAWLIASTQWEPARDPQVAQLRLWADSYYRAREVVGGTTNRELGPGPGAADVADVTVVSAAATLSPAPLVAADPPGIVGAGPWDAPPRPAPHRPAPIPGAGGSGVTLQRSSPPAGATGRPPAPTTAYDGSHRAQPPSSVPFPPGREAGAGPTPLAFGAAAPPRAELLRPAMVDLAEACLGTPVLWLRYEPAADGTVGEPAGGASSLS
jgi:hypothetical protein